MKKDDGKQLNLFDELMESVTEMDEIRRGECEAGVKRNLFDELVEGMQALREERMKVKPINTEKEYKAAIARTWELLGDEPKPGWSEDDEELKLMYREMQDYELRRGDVAPVSVMKRLGLYLVFVSIIFPATIVGYLLAAIKEGLEYGKEKFKNHLGAVR